MSFSLSLHAAGLIVVYSSYGYFQEKIMRGSTYGAEGERFTSSALLILCNRVFSILVGLGIIYLKSLKAGRVPGTTSRAYFLSRIRPASPVLAYAAVALCNFLSTTCQYEALKYVSYTTQSLAKCAKMIPVLLVGAIVWKKSYQPREWAAGAIILVGCGTYLLSQPPRVSSHASSGEHDDSFASGLAGALFLMGYLFFDGLVSTTQERVFGKNPTSSDPFGPDSPVLDQMIWTNCFAGLIAIATALLSNVSGSLLPNLHLLLTSPALMWDVILLSATSAIGLIILLNTIASFGALTSSLIMTTRQFLSILINAGIFGNFGSVGLLGWTGVGWVASGIYIKMNRSFDPPKKPSGARSAGLLEKDVRDAGELESLAAGQDGELHILTPKFTTPQTVASRSRTYLYQYVIPVAVPVGVVILCSPLLGLASGTTSNRAVQGGTYDHAIHAVIAPVCHHNFTTVPYTTGTKKTGFVTAPRSGNSYLRSLVERATGYQSTSTYCDRELEKTFIGECDHVSKFFIKDHFPAIDRHFPVQHIDYFARYDRTVHLVRNPLDSIASWWQLSHSELTVEGYNDHAGRQKIDQYGDDHRDEMLDFARKWRRHSIYWQNAPISTHTMRYEDLKASPISEMFGLLNFLLPEEDLPSLEDLACMTESDKTHEAYVSKRSSNFASWDTWSDSLRAEVLEITRRPFCSFGYDQLLFDTVGEKPGMKDFCKGMKYEEGEPVVVRVESEDRDRQRETELLELASSQAAAAEAAEKKEANSLEEAWERL